MVLYFIRNSILHIGIITMIPTFTLSQVSIFSEVFDESSNSTSGISAEGVSWSTSCPTCVPGADYFAVQSGSLENLDSNGPATFSFDSPIDVSLCSSIQINFDFAFSEGWEGSGNLEFCNEESGGSPACNIGTPPCSTTCDPSTPTLGSCNGCWDFLWAQAFLDNSEVSQELIGGFNTTDSDQSGTIMMDFCTNGAVDLNMMITTQMWANDESVEINNIAIICFENEPMVEVDGSEGPIELCVGDDVDLTEVNVSPSKLDGGDSWNWMGPNGGFSGSSTYTLADVQLEDSGLYTVNTLDVNGCSAEDDIMIVITVCCDAEAGSITITK